MGPEFAPPPPQRQASAPYPPSSPEPPRPRRLARSRRERMWAGVAGGMAEYFDLDPNLVRVLWVAATILSHGVGVAVYILFWIILPKADSSPESNPADWHDWSHDFHSETQRLAEEARRVAHGVRGGEQPWRAAGPTDGFETSHDPASPAAAPGEYGSQQAPSSWWADAQRGVEPHHLGSHPRSTGIVLVTLGVVLLAANAGVFNWIDWQTIWPVILIGFGVMLLARRSGWGR